VSCNSRRLGLFFVSIFMVSTSVVDPGPGAFLTVGSGIRYPGWVENQGPDLGFGDIPDNIFESLEKIYGV
jgi:hypothetical protein